MLARTYLFVPGHRPERFDKALASGADAVVLDLEDAVGPVDKDGARESVRQRLLASNDRLVVRINDEASAWFAADLELLAHAAAVMLPKAEQASTIARLLEVNPKLAVLPLVETARGVLRAEALADAPGVQRLVFGTVDFALDLDLSGDPLGLDYAASKLALASRAAGIASPVAGVTTALDDESVLLGDLERARAHGFGAKLCIHPKQVAPIHAALSPTAAQIDWAHRVIEAGASGAAVQVDGKMVDKPILLQAQRLLARQGR